MSKSGKSAYLRHVFANNFFCTFFKTFSSDFVTFFDFFKKEIILGHISTFFKLWSQMRKKLLKKTENLFFINMS
jgi:hypothetical protein